MMKIPMEVIMFTIYVLFRLFCSVTDMLTIGNPKKVMHADSTSHLRLIRKYIALPDIKKIPTKNSIKYFITLKYSG